MVTISGAEGCAVRSVAGRDYGFDVTIIEKRWKHGVRIQIVMEGITLTRHQHRELCRQLALWKYGLSEVEPASASAFAQAHGLREFQAAF